MRRAAASSVSSRLLRALLGPAGVLAVCACSVYSNDLVGPAPPSTPGGSSGVGGNDGPAEAGSDSGGSPPLADAGGGGEDAAEGGEPALGGSAPVAGSGGSSAGGSSAGSGGTSGVAGSSPTAGSGGIVGGINSPNLLDGFEDNDLVLEQTNGRGGVWYLFNDGTAGTQGPLACTPLSGEREELGSYALHITAEKFTLWGSGLGVDFRPGRLVYNASKFSGISFWAKVGAGKNTRHRLQIADSSTDPAGKKCSGTADATKCGNHFGVYLTLTAAWAQYRVAFADFEQVPGWGLPADALDPSAIYGLEVTAKQNVAVDLWLDQIEFF